MVMISTLSEKAATFPYSKLPYPDYKEQPVELRAINTIRTLSVDAVQAANSGHPGTAMGLAPVVYHLWQNVLRYDPEEPLWPNRDRFVLSVGHASMLLYSILHLCRVKGVDKEGLAVDEPAMSLDDIRTFRQLGSRAAGHPEYGHAAGIEMTTGPLGQGLATSVGMAVASRWLGARYNKPGFTLFDYNVYALCGDGCMMEGLSSEAASLAAHHKLSNLCWIYDRNMITIEGSTDIAFSEDVAARFKAYGWEVVTLPDVNDLVEIGRTVRGGSKGHSGPTLIIVNSHIAFGAPKKQDSASAHGEPLGETEVKETKKNYGWPEEPPFFVPEGVYEHFTKGIGDRGRKLLKSWQEAFNLYKKQFPELANEIRLLEARELPQDWNEGLKSFAPDEKGVATREASGKVLNAIAEKVPWLIGGSADLAPSTKTFLKFEGAGVFSASHPEGRNIHFGVREHAMAAVINGLALSKVRAYGSGFLIFSDYARPSIRLSALMEMPVIHIFTHDSIAVGEDGPTHQPIEHLAALRAMPGLLVMRPADANEVIECWRIIMGLKREPVALILSRQNLPVFDRTIYKSANGVKKGAYILADSDGETPQVLFLASGSEVGLCVQAFHELKKKGVPSRVVSMPSWELFERQDKKYKETVIPESITKRIAVEMASPLGWERYAGPKGVILGMRSFGASAPMKKLLEKFGFNCTRILQHLG